MSAHQTGCQACNQEHQALRQRHQTLLADYRSLTLKNQLLRNTQAAYEQRNEELCRAAMRHEVAVRQLKYELEQARATGGNKASLPTDLFESEKFRRDVNRNQQLNHIIDAKNKDLAFLKEQMKSPDSLTQKNQELQQKVQQLTQSLQMSQQRIQTLERDRPYPVSTQPLQWNPQSPSYSQPENNVAVTRQSNTRQSLPDSSFQRRTVPQSEGAPNLTASVLNSLKVGSPLNSTKVTSPGTNPRGELNMSCSCRGSRRQEERGRGQWLVIQSRIEQLQLQNDHMRGELISKIY